MTFKEKLKQEYQIAADKYFGCPKHLDYEMENIHCKQMSCIECWNREIPGTEDNTENTTKNLADKMEEFICSVCHIHLFDFFEQKYNRDRNYHYEEIFECSYCPECGRKVVD